MLSISWHVRVFVCLFVCLSVTLSHSLEQSFCYHFPKSNVQTFWYSESLGKSNGKEWSQIWLFLLIKGLKWPPQKKFFDGFFICSFCLNVFLSPLSKVKCPNFLDIRNSWEKVKGRNCLRLSREALPPVCRIFFPICFW